mmetsp:Transcript_13225/g.38363  ORF Transcript_13225/g.38363 Transcript_13225/m.38363 type:complete len:243 (+) Transcript_13225:2098-2826(+)
MLMPDGTRHAERHRGRQAAQVRHLQVPVLPQVHIHVTVFFFVHTQQLGDAKPLVRAERRMRRGHRGRRDKPVTVQTPHDHVAIPHMPHHRQIAPEDHQAGRRPKLDQPRPHLRVHIHVRTPLQGLQTKRRIRTSLFEQRRRWKAIFRRSPPVETNHLLVRLLEPSVDHFLEFASRDVSQGARIEFLRQLRFNVLGDAHPGRPRGHLPQHPVPIHHQRNVHLAAAFQPYFPQDHVILIQRTVL